jgi:Protein of unknown function (DUF4435)
VGSKNSRPTVEEIYALLKKTSLPTVLVEGKDDIIFYRAIEDELRDLDIDMLPAGNKDAVLEIRKKIKNNPISAPVVFIVDNDLWVHSFTSIPPGIDDVITTSGYSIENDLFHDGSIECLLSPSEKIEFQKELTKFTNWYAISLSRHLISEKSGFRLHPNKVLDDEVFYQKETMLKDNEFYPHEILNEITSNHYHFIRGKSLFALLLRQLSATKRDVKFSGKQLMAIGASRKGLNFQKMCIAIRQSLLNDLHNSHPTRG